MGEGGGELGDNIAGGRGRDGLAGGWAAAGAGILSSLKMCDFLGRDLLRIRFDIQPGSLTRVHTGRLKSGRIGPTWGHYRRYRDAALVRHGDICCAR
jgi:hypothetical protein